MANMLLPTSTLSTEFSAEPDALNESSVAWLEDWQKEQLWNTTDMGKKCFLGMWQNFNYSQLNGSYCNAAWDNIYCWPPTPADTQVVRQCSEAFRELSPAHASNLVGIATRFCLSNGTWSKGVKTNYDECANSFEANEEAAKTMSIVQHILFVGSIVSLVTLASSLAIFFKFSVLWCDRVKILVHLMAALLVRSALLIVITEPSLFERESSYRDVNWLCKSIICVFLYATVSSVFWMFVFGHYLNTTLTTVAPGGAASQRKFIVYYLLGWMLPAMLISAYVTAMVSREQQEWCWKGYSQMPEMWIVVGPMYFAIVVNFFFLVNIVRIVFLKARRSRAQRETSQISAPVKATMILFFVLGVNNLLVFLNLGGKFEKYYTITNTLFGSTQGMTVSCLYCFNSKEVHNAFRRCYNRFKARRNVDTANSRRQQQPAAPAQAEPEAVVEVPEEVPEPEPNNQPVQEA